MMVPIGGFANLSVSDGPGFGSEEFGRWADLGVREL